MKTLGVSRQRIHIPGLVEIIDRKEGVELGGLIHLLFQKDPGCHIRKNCLLLGLVANGASHHGMRMTVLRRLGLLPFKVHVQVRFCL